jgi:spermidine synthase
VVGVPRVGDVRQTGTITEVTPRRSRPGTDRFVEPPVGVHPIDTGTAEIVRDRTSARAYLLLVNGVESSHVDLDDPAWLDFEYLRWMTAVIEAHVPTDVRISALHLGAAACSLARHLLAVRPDSHHLAVELDAALAQGVREWFGLPSAPSLRIRVGEAREVTEALAPASRNVVVRDVFAGSATPPALTTLAFTTAVRRVLRPGGLYLLNCGDVPDLALARAEAATVAEVFGQVAIVADPAMLKGRRRGNVVVVGADAPLEHPGLARDLLGGAVPAQLWDDRRVREFARHSAPLRD